jgi:hypothetical protein
MPIIGPVTSTSRWIRMCMFSRMTSMSLPNTKPYFVCEGTRGTAAVEKNLRRVCTWKRERLQLHGARRQARHCRGQLSCSSAPFRTPPLCIRRRDETWQSGAAHRRPAARCVRRWASSDRNGYNVEWRPRRGSLVAGRTHHAPPPTYPSW